MIILIKLIIFLNYFLLLIIFAFLIENSFLNKDLNDKFALIFSSLIFLSLTIIFGFLVFVAMVKFLGFKTILTLLSSILILLLFSEIFSFINY